MTDSQPTDRRRDEHARGALTLFTELLVACYDHAASAATPRR